jgi:hypothetical protein
LPFGGFTIENAPSPWRFLPSEAAAAWIPRRPGVAYFPEALSIEAKRILFCSA